MTVDAVAFDLTDLASIEHERIAGKRVLVREDLNVPMHDGQVADDSRLQAAVETISFLADREATVVVCSHLGRPNGAVVAELSLKPVAARLAELLGRPVTFVSECIGELAEAAVRAAHPGDVLLLENTRFHAEETDNDPEFARALARLADLYVNDAFGTVHRANASTAGVAAYIPSFAGFLLQRELTQLGRLLKNPARPFVAVIGGVKVGDKIGVLERLVELADAVLIGGAMACTFHAAKGVDMGASKVEGADGQALARRILDAADASGCSIVLPIDVVVADRFAADADTRDVPIESVPADWMALDIGPRSRMMYVTRISEAHTVFWNGPMGVFEMDAFQGGTLAVATAVADSPGNTVVGGGDSLAALAKFQLGSRITHVSTGGGAALALIEGAPLPGIEALKAAPQ